MDLKEEGILGADIARHWYYRAKSAALMRMLGGIAVQSVLDVGAGSGFFARELLRQTRATEAVCVDPFYAAERDEAVAGKPLRFRRGIERSTADLVLMMDVLEHVDDDIGLVRDYAEKLPPGARFLVTVPAFRFLWSGHDVFLEHRRRYTLPAIEAVLRASGLSVELGCYFYGLLFPLAAATRLLARLRPQAEPKSQLRRAAPAVNAALWSICRAELPLFRANRLGGLTAIVLARKA